MYRAESLEELQGLCERFVAQLGLGPCATVIALSGELGAGKTTFVQTVARTLGVVETVNSPTFVIEKIYALEDQAFKRLIHIDAYRLKSEQELRLLGWDEIVQDPGNLILIEWPEKVPGLIPENALKIRFDIEGDARIITIDGGKEINKKHE